ncbi:MAG: RNA polymerase sigma-70 factor [Fulvivirga sp.]|uniref:RNA polymerase sigma-70 factor n=1 Tax=Fulvivirga sp. TaxID=1931237 RepID=UPI0032EB5264
MSENISWRNIQEGDQFAFKTLFQSTYKKLVLTSIYYVENTEEAEDIVQNVFLNLWNKRNKLTIEGELIAYLTTAVRNQSLNVLEKRKTKKKYQEYLSFNSIDTNQYLSDPFFLEKLQNAIERLPEKCRLVFIKNRLEGMKNKEIAEELSISIKTVENQIGKALHLMRDALRDYLPLIAMAAFIK